MRRYIYMNANNEFLCKRADGYNWGYYLSTEDVHKAQMYKTIKMSETWPLNQGRLSRASIQLDTLRLTEVEIELRKV